MPKWIEYAPSTSSRLRRLVVKGTTAAAGLTASIWAVFGQGKEGGGGGGSTKRQNKGAQVKMQKAANHAGVTKALIRRLMCSRFNTAAFVIGMKATCASSRECKFHATDWQR